MTKWLLALAITVVVVGIFAPRLAERIGIGRVPGDVTIELRGRHYRFPFASTLLLSLLAVALMRLL
jgi:hypothetical protein